MTRFRFIHAADLHLDTPFDGIGRVAPEIAGRLRDASLEAFDHLIQLTLDRDVSFLLLAGDIYDGPEHGVRAQLRFLRGVERLGERGIAVFAVHGNHDPPGSWPAARTQPANWITFGPDGVEACPIMRGGQQIATVYGISHAHPEVSENLALRFERQAAPGLHVGLLHCNVAGVGGHASYSPCSVEDLTRARMDYWALGHVHQRQYLSAGQPWIVYPGSLQARSAKASERGEKGAVVVEVAGNDVERIDFVPLDCVRYAELEIDVSLTGDVSELDNSISAQAEELRLAADGRDLLVCVVLAGRGPLHADLRREGAVAELLRHLREELAGASPFVWIDRILDRTRAELDREAIATRGDFSSDLTRAAAELLADPVRLNAFCNEQFGPLDRPSLRKWLPALSSCETQALFRDAEELALELLEGEQDS